jgi:limonene-1,2-epoxide hydrolase
MRLTAAFIVIAAALLASGFRVVQNPDVRIVRAWSAALNAGDDARAAGYFAPNARVIQGSLVAVLRTRRSAVVFNASLPCSGKIVAVTVAQHLVTAAFVLGQRPGHRCDGPGQRAFAAFRIRNGRIILWHQLPSPTGTGGTTA